MKKYIIPFDRVERQCCWNGSEIGGNGGWKERDGLFCSNMPGTMCAFDFEGTEVVLKNAAGTSIDVSVDRGPYRTISGLNGDTVVASGLKAGNHRMLLRVPEPGAWHISMEDDYTVVDPESAVSFAAITVTGNELPEKHMIPYSMVTRDGRRLVEFVDGAHSEFRLVPEAELPENTPPVRQWKLYMIQASHTDIGLHHSQYIQRHGSVLRTKQAEALVDADKRTDSDPAAYRYVQEHDWFFRNFSKDMPVEETKRLVENYFARGRIGTGVGFAHNHTHVLGEEELCRSAYTRKRLHDDWGVNGATMMMTDNPGFSWSMIAPYAEAGYKYLLYSPNHWNPILSTVNACDKTFEGYPWFPQSGGGGDRVEVGFDSELPMVFRWMAKDGKHSLLTWCCTQYDRGYRTFGIEARTSALSDDIEKKTARMLKKLEKRYPYDIWLAANYFDDEVPNTANADFCAAWNEKWAMPTFATVANMDIPFRELEERFGDQIPCLSGEMTSGWLQHCACAPELLARKFAVDRELPVAETMAVLSGKPVPKTEFNRAYYHLLLNDEHSYGTSSYRGRDVVETWEQHLDWIEKAEKTAEHGIKDGIKALAERAGAGGRFYYNPTLQARVTCDGIKVPPLGWTSAAQCKTIQDSLPETVVGHPVLENSFYRVEFADDGSITSVFDKELRKELADKTAGEKINQIVYTNDNHRSFVSPRKAIFTIARNPILGDVVKVTTSLDELGADIVQEIRLRNDEKAIDITDSFEHATDLFHFNERYRRYGYVAFPFDVPGAKAVAQLNGPVVDAKKELTGHNTDAFIGVRDWCAVENDAYGVALIQQDSMLMEFGKIHPDKTVYGEPLDNGRMYSYIFADWLQRHKANGESICPSYRYTITSYSGSWRKAAIPAFAERIINPVLAVDVPGQHVDSSGSFLSVDKPNIRLLTLKPAEDSHGIIARFKETDGVETAFSIKHSFAPDADVTRVTVDERPLGGKIVALPYGIVTLRISSDVAIAEPNDTLPYTGLIDSPRCVHSEEQGELFLLWGRDENAVKYEVYRKDNSGAFNLIGTSENEVYNGIGYVVARYADKGLEVGKSYTYKVRSVYKNNSTGKFSEEFSGRTRKDVVSQ